MSDKIKDTLSVDDFGGDMKAALACAIANGRSLYFPTGEYTLTPDVWGILNTVKYGFDKPFFWIEMPDGKRNHFITRGKFMASLAVLRMNYPDLKLQPVGTLPAPKRKPK
jgi:hypothetical protein